MLKIIRTPKKYIFGYLVKTIGKSRRTSGHLQTLSSISAESGKKETVTCGVEAISNHAFLSECVHLSNCLHFCPIVSTFVRLCSSFSDCVHFWQTFTKVSTDTDKHKCNDFPDGKCRSASMQLRLERYKSTKITKKAALDFQKGETLVGHSECRDEIDRLILCSVEHLIA